MPLSRALEPTVGYIPFEPEAANLFFQLVSSRHERASQTSNKAFGRWDEERQPQPSRTAPSPGGNEPIRLR